MLIERAWNDFDPKVRFDDMLQRRNRRAKPTRELARDLWAYACEPIPWYVPCGTSDVIGERKEDARLDALAIWRVLGRPLP